MKDRVIAGVLSGLIIAIAMRYIPIFHGYDSNDVAKIIFTDEFNKQYLLVPEKVKCNL